MKFLGSFSIQESVQLYEGLRKLSAYNAEAQDILLEWEDPFIEKTCEVTPLILKAIDARIEHCYRELINGSDRFNAETFAMQFRLRQQLGYFLKADPLSLSAW